jgi:Domain of unknown function (DUF1707)
MDTESSSFPRGIRVSDADRDQAVAELSEHFQSGRLTQDEFEDRSGRALQARTGGDLTELFTDLPGRPVVTAWPAPGPAAAPVLAGGGVSHPGFHPARVIIPVVIAAIVMFNVFGGGQHQNVGWLVPVLVLTVVFLRLGLVRRHR